MESRSINLLLNFHSAKAVCENCILKDGCLYDQQFSGKHPISHMSIILSTHAAAPLFLGQASMRGGESRYGTPLTHSIFDEDFTNLLIKNTTFKVEDVQNWKDNIEHLLDNLKKQPEVDFVSIKNLTALYESMKVLKSLFKTDKKDDRNSKIRTSKFDLVSVCDVLTDEEKETLRTSLNYLNDDNNYVNGELFGIETVSDINNIPMVGITSLIRTILGEYEYDQALIYENEIVLHQRQTNLINTLSHTAMLMDATADEDFLNTVFDNQIEFHKLEIEHNENLEVNLWNSFPKSSQGMNEKSLKAIEEFANEYLDPNKKNGLIARKKQMVGVDNQHPIPNVQVWGHYGKDSRGSNEFEDCDTLTVTQYSPNLNAEIIKYQILTGKKFKTEKDKYEYRYNGFGELVRKPQTGNEKFDNFYRERIFSEQYQTLQRLRFKNRSDQKLVIHMLGEAIFDPRMPKVTQYRTFTSTAKRNRVKSYNDEAVEAMKVRYVSVVTAITTNEKFKSYKKYGSVKDFIDEYGKWQLAHDLYEITGIPVSTLLRYFNDKRFSTKFAELVPSAVVESHDGEETFLSIDEFFNNLLDAVFEQQKIDNAEQLIKQHRKSNVT